MGLFGQGPLPTTKLTIQKARREIEELEENLQKKKYGKYSKSKMRDTLEDLSGVVSALQRHSELGVLSLLEFQDLQANKRTVQQILADRRNFGEQIEIVREVILKEVYGIELETPKNEKPEKEKKITLEERHEEAVNKGILDYMRHAKVNMTAVEYKQEIRKTWTERFGEDVAEQMIDEWESSMAMDLHKDL